MSGMSLLFYCGSWNNVPLPHRDSTEAHEAPRRAAPRSALESEEYVRDIIGSLNAKDFRERISGVRQLLADTESSPALVLANVVRVTPGKGWNSKGFRAGSQSFL